MSVAQTFRRAGERSLCTSFVMSFHLSGSSLEVMFAPIPQCVSSRSDSSGGGSCVVEVDAWRQAWLLCCALAQWVVAAVVLFVGGVGTVVSQVREIMRRFDLAVEPAVLYVRGTGSAGWLRVVGLVAGVLISFLVGDLAVHCSVLCDGFIVAMGLAVVCQSGGGASLNVVESVCSFARCGDCSAEWCGDCSSG